MRYDTTLVDNLIKKKYKTRKEFCKAAGFTDAAISRAFKRGKFTTDQIYITCKILGIRDEYIASYFFRPTVPKR